MPDPTQVAVFPQPGKPFVVNRIVNTPQEIAVAAFGDKLPTDTEHAALQYAAVLAALNPDVPTELFSGSKLLGRTLQIPSLAQLESWISAHADEAWGPLPVERAADASLPDSPLDKRFRYLHLFFRDIERLKKLQHDCRNSATLSYSISQNNQSQLQQLFGATVPANWWEILKRMEAAGELFGRFVQIDTDLNSEGWHADRASPDDAWWQQLRDRGFKIGAPVRIPSADGQAARLFYPEADLQAALDVLQSLRRDIEYRADRALRTIALDDPLKEHPFWDELLGFMRSAGAASAALAVGWMADAVQQLATTEAGRAWIRTKVLPAFLDSGKLRDPGQCPVLALNELHPFFAAIAQASGATHWDDTAAFSGAGYDVTGGLASLFEGLGLLVSLVLGQEKVINSPLIGVACLSLGYLLGNRRLQLRVGALGEELRQLRLLKFYDAATYQMDALGLDAAIESRAQLLREAEKALKELEAGLDTELEGIGADLETLLADETLDDLKLGRLELVFAAVQGLFAAVNTILAIKQSEGRLRDHTAVIKNLCDFATVGCQLVQWSAARRGPALLGTAKAAKAAAAWAGVASGVFETITGALEWGQAEYFEEAKAQHSFYSGLISLLASVGALLPGPGTLLAIVGGIASGVMAVISYYWDELAENEESKSFKLKHARLQQLAWQLPWYPQRAGATFRPNLRFAAASDVSARPQLMVETSYPYQHQGSLLTAFPALEDKQLAISLVALSPGNQETPVYFDPSQCTLRSQLQSVPLELAWGQIKVEISDHYCEAVPPVPLVARLHVLDQVHVHYQSRKQWVDATRTFEEVMALEDAGSATSFSKEEQMLLAEARRILAEDAVSQSATALLFPGSSIVEAPEQRHTLRKSDWTHADPDIEMSLSDGKLAVQLANVPESAVGKTLALRLYDLDNWTSGHDRLVSHAGKDFWLADPPQVGADRKIRFVLPEASFKESSYDPGWEAEGSVIEVQPCVHELYLPWHAPEDSDQVFQSPAFWRLTMSGGTVSSLEKPAWGTHLRFEPLKNPNAGGGRTTLQFYNIPDMEGRKLRVSLVDEDGLLNANDAAWRVIGDPAALETLALEQLRDFIRNQGFGQTIEEYILPEAEKRELIERGFVRTVVAGALNEPICLNKHPFFGYGAEADMEVQLLVEEQDGGTWREVFRSGNRYRLKMYVEWGVELKDLGWGWVWGVEEVYVQ